MIKEIRENWILLVFIASLIATWTTFSNRLSAVEVLSQENKSTLEIVKEVQIDIAVMKRDIEFIKLQVK